MARPTADIQGCLKAHERLRALIDEMTDATARRPSRLPDWTVGHVLTHIARNAEAMVLRIRASVQGDLIDQYPGGPEGRDREIVDGASRPARELVDDITEWSSALDDAFGQLPDEAWDLQVRTVGGDTHAISLLPFRRWREVEVHMADLDLGFTPEEWSPELVSRVLPRLLDQLPQRADEHQLAAWMLGRSEPPRLTPWA